MLSFLFLLAQAAEEGRISSVEIPILVAVIAVCGTLGAAWFTFRGKTQDTANWLLKELRTDAEEARKSADMCEQHRLQDRALMEEMRAQQAGMAAGMRTIKRENERLQQELNALRRRMEEHEQLDSERDARNDRPAHGT